jgi:hypothetical protein
MTAVIDTLDLKDAIDLTNTSDVYAKAKRYADAAKDAVVDTRILHHGRGRQPRRARRHRATSNSS